MTFFQLEKTIHAHYVKIAFCLEYPLALRGGVSVLVENLLVEISRQGHETVVVSPDSEEALEKLPAEILPRKHLCWDPSNASHLQSQHLAARLARLRVDIAHFHMGGNYGWGNRFPFQSPIVHVHRHAIPAISTSHLVVGILDGYCGPQKPLAFKLAMLPLAWASKLQQLRSVRYEIAVSQHDFLKLRRWYAPLHNRFVQIYHSRLHEQPFIPRPNRKPVILNVGHLAWRKGQLVLAEAFVGIAKRYPEWTLQLAGHDDGVTAAKIQALAQKHGLGERIQLLGERNDALKLMNEASIYVQPSFWEALGLALQEAMFDGCPAIGSRAGGIPELIDHESNGLLVDPGNVSQMAQALEQLITNRSMRERFGASAAQSIRSKGMTVENMVQRHLDLYDRAIQH